MENVTESVREEMKRIHDKYNGTIFYDANDEIEPTTVNGSYMKMIEKEIEEKLDVLCNKIQNLEKELEDHILKSAKIESDVILFKNDGIKTNKEENEEISHKENTDDDEEKESID